MVIWSSGKMEYDKEEEGPGLTTASKGGGGE